MNHDDMKRFWSYVDGLTCLYDGKRWVTQWASDPRPEYAIEMIVVEDDLRADVTWLTFTATKLIAQVPVLRGSDDHELIQEVLSDVAEYHNKQLNKTGV